jgi:hypothetical protein
MLFVGVEEQADQEGASVSDWNAALPFWEKLSILLLRSGLAPCPIWRSAAVDTMMASAK